jgi:hypothetical protein
MLAAMTVVVLCTSATLAEEKAKKLTGTYTKKVGDHELKFAFNKDSTLKFTMSNGKDGCVLDAKYTLEKDGTVKCETTKFEKKGDFPVEKQKGYAFSFKAEFKDKTAQITEFKGEDVDENAKNVLEGEYSQDS